MIKRDRMIEVAKQYFNTFVDICFDSYIQYGEDKSVVVLKHFMEDYHVNELEYSDGSVSIKNLTIGDFFCSKYKTSEDEIKTFEEIFFSYLSSAMAYEITKMVQQLLIETFETNVEFKYTDKIIAEIDVSYFSQQYQNKFNELVSIIGNHRLLDRKISDFLPIKKIEDN